MINNFQKILDHFSDILNRSNAKVETWIIGALDNQDFHPMWLSEKKCREIFECPQIKIDWSEEFFKLEKKHLK
jgi:hypothetical protein